MIARVGLLLILFGLFGDTIAEQGREGNVRFRNGEFAAAANAYKKVTSQLDDTTGIVYSRLQNNLGMALQRQQKYESAYEAFKRARRTATVNDDRVRALFNGANVAAALGNRKEALRSYKNVLLLDPSHEDARFNYEYLKRNTTESSRAERQSVEPSPYARRLKKKAEVLVSKARYTAAAALMKDGMQSDSTVAAYRQFIRRIEQVAQINRSER